MRNTKYILSNFTFYDRTGIQAYLEKQAAKGWLLEEAGNLSWRFRRDYPRKLHFAVVYFHKADIYDPEPSEQERTFQEFCAHGGWTLAASNAQMQIFYSEAEDPTPIETDPVIEVENIHRSMKKNVLLGYWMLLASSVLQLAAQWINFSGNFIGYLSRDLNLFFAVSWITLLLVGISRLSCYYRWRKRARAAAEQDGIFLETRSFSGVEAVVCALLIVGLVGVLATMENRQTAVMLGVMAVLGVGIVFVVEAFRRGMKKGGHDANTSKTATLIFSVIVSFVVIVFGSFLVADWVGGIGSDSREEDAGLALNIQDLLEEEREYQTLVLYDQKSILLEYQKIYQRSDEEETLSYLEYELVKVKAPFLYQRCLTEMMDVPSRISGAEYQPIDPVPWGAEQAWQLREGDAMELWYVLCYEDAIVELLPSWELTQEQMAAVGALIG